MRLGQLARKLKKDPNDILKYLESKGLEVDNSPNFKIDETIAQELIDQSEAEVVQEDPVPAVVEVETSETEEVPVIENDPIEEIAAVPEVEKEEVVEEAVEEVIESELVEKELTEETQEEDEEGLDPENEYAFVEDKKGVIRAPKVTLEGIKVVGKIDLPESKKVEEEPEVEKEVEEASGEVPAKEKGPKVHPNKQSRVVGSKPKFVKAPKKEEVEIKKPTKEELKAKRKAEKKKKAKLNQNKPKPQAKKKKKKKTPPPPKRSFWQKLFGLGKQKK
ncbi:translation initiation factor IF-2 N-terminal domain-containing protein [Cyclobacteriaceae bacterium]|nr:translation initiation factor IF-2 N-terminal domain-containing protein [Cyclobacteriaceae bacterium]